MGINLRDIVAKREISFDELKGKRLVVRGSTGKIIDTDIKELKEAWQGTLRW